ncbi:Uncharacterised protein [Enterobacter asburiae]|uniref:Uncharacterized protein n=1 Tax=Enterobacter asburiae TaxID=61645 RepID=A0A376FER2_ENTAS|nr:Uncharacterised protein [Enterobacter asburiae]
MVTSPSPSGNSTGTSFIECTAISARFSSNASSSSLTNRPLPPTFARGRIEDHVTARDHRHQLDAQSTVAGFKALLHIMCLPERERALACGNSPKHCLTCLLPSLSIANHPNIVDSGMAVLRLMKRERDKAAYSSAIAVFRNLHVQNGATLVCSASFFTVNRQGVKLITF